VSCSTRLPTGCETAAEGYARITYGSSETPRTITRGERSYLLLPGRAHFIIDGTAITLTIEVGGDDELLDIADSLILVDHSRP